MIHTYTHTHTGCYQKTSFVFANASIDFVFFFFFSIFHCSVIEMCEYIYFESGVITIAEKIDFGREILRVLCAGTSIILSKAILFSILILFYTKFASILRVCNAL